MTFTVLCSLYNSQMTLADLQNQVLEFDKERGWERVESAHIVLHLMEELGEVAREVLRGEAYKDGHPRLASEMSDFLILFAKLANAAGVDLCQAVPDKLAELRERFPIAEAREAIERYNHVKGGKRK